MLNRSVLQLTLALIVSVNVFAQSSPNPSSPSNQNPSLESTVKLAVKAMIIDRDLNVKPIPKFVFSLERITDRADKGQTLALTTKVDGTAEMQVPPGRYRIVSARPWTSKASTTHGICNSP
jgi:hypothetical protein